MGQKLNPSMYEGSYFLQTGILVPLPRLSLCWELGLHNFSAVPVAQLGTETWSKSNNINGGKSCLKLKAGSQVTQVLWRAIERVSFWAHTGKQQLRTPRLHLLGQQQEHLLVASVGFANDLDDDLILSSSQITLCFDHVFIYTFVCLSNILGFQVYGILFLHCFGSCPLASTEWQVCSSHASCRKNWTALIVADLGKG